MLQNSVHNTTGNSDSLGYPLTDTGGISLTTSHTRFSFSDVGTWRLHPDLTHERDADSPFLVDVQPVAIVFVFYLMYGMVLGSIFTYKSTATFATPLDSGNIMFIRMYFNHVIKFLSAVYRRCK
jgi:hypothetical protein